MYGAYMQPYSYAYAQHYNPHMAPQYGHNGMVSPGGYPSNYYAPQAPIYNQQPPLQHNPYQHSPGMPAYAMNQQHSIPQQPVTASFAQPPTIISSLPPTPASNAASQAPPNPFTPPAQQHVEPVQDYQSYPDEPVEADITAGSDVVQQSISSRSSYSVSTDSPPLDIPQPNPQAIWGALPWSTHEDEPWPKRKKLKKKKAKPIANEGVSLQATQHQHVETIAPDQDNDGIRAATDAPDRASYTEETSSTVKLATDTMTTSTPEASTLGTQTTPSMIVHSQPAKAPTSKSTAATVTALPALPKAAPPASQGPIKPTEEENGGKPDGEAVVQSDKVGDTEPQEAKSGTKPAFKNWAAVLRGPTAAKSFTGAQTGQNGTTVAGGMNAGTQTHGTSGIGLPGNKTLAEVLGSYRVDSNDRTAFFIEPRGLLNSGVDCYMNSILQVLLYCRPFYNFLNEVKTKCRINMRLLLLEALIEFHDQFRVMDMASTPEQLRSRVQDKYQQFGEPFRADFLYEKAFKTPVFVKSKLKLGKQQDAEEFLTLLFDGLQTECAGEIKDASDTTSRMNEEAEGWTTVDNRQKSTVTQSTGPLQVPTPLTRIFQGQTRSELRGLGRKDSSTDQPFYTFRLHIDDPSVRNVSQAMEWSNVTQSIKDYPTPKGAVTATQQQFIHKLPAVLILQLVRFEQSNDGSYRKNGKKVGYPLDLDIPPAVLSRPRRNEYAASKTGIPRYKLTAVVYHHGADMHHGHYSVDVRRQDGESWMRINDTKLEAISSHDVTDMSGEEVPLRPTATNKDAGIDTSVVNRFAAMGDAENSADDGGDWKQVGPTNGTKKYSNVVNGKSSGASTPRGAPGRDARDNKVAYLLFYSQQQI
ncbi:hypothetical protein BD289DRAFT_450785 [Coniella lustricola]|uniref:ubiquitinyl hydrolase 1 n=1 Tax=Coniella lustricola TaxID=2025994 RepID=A0A2T3AHC3_9PEZI|nr:hypothetical protein BD289DRAFT_450785 [Coniella lustricola]